MANGANFEWRAIQRLRAQLGRLADVSPADRQELADHVAMLMVEDNRAGVLAGVDKNGNPAPMLVYRGGYGKRTAFRRATDAAFGKTARGVRRDRSRAGFLRFKGLSRYTFTDRAGRKRILANNNLSTWQYQQLDGPRLAPRRDASRVIANYGPVSPVGTWDGRRLVVTCAWIDIVSPKGVPFLRAHLTGANGLPKYDIAGVRPIGKRKVLAAVRGWARHLLGIS